MSFGRNQAVAVLFGLFALGGFLLRQQRGGQVPAFADSACRKAYLALFDRQTVDVRMVFGYKDARPARFVGDRYERMIFVQEITRPCSAGRGDCGFKPTADGFEKTLQGPDGRQKTVHLTVTHSSSGPDDEANRGNPFQRWQSEFARQSFVDGLKTADIVFYNGHSRSGGGPDFEPPHLDSSGHVPYAWYKAKATGLRLMVNALRDAPASRLRILGLFSCASSRLFNKRIKKARGALAVISTDQLLYFSESIERSLDALSDVLELRCRTL